MEEIEMVGEKPGIYYRKEEVQKALEAADNRADIAEMKLAKAEALIQQMKCCYNCDHQGNNQKRCAECWNFDKWEIRK